MEMELRRLQNSLHLWQVHKHKHYNIMVKTSFIKGKPSQFPVGTKRKHLVSCFGVCCGSNFNSPLLPIINIRYGWSPLTGYSQRTIREHRLGLIVKSLYQAADLGSVVTFAFKDLNVNIKDVFTAMLLESWILWSLGWIRSTKSARFFFRKLMKKSIVFVFFWVSEEETVCRFLR